MAWDYRVMTLNGGESYEIYEVYYNDKGKPSLYTANSSSPFGENIRELYQDVMWMIEALDMPVLTLQDFQAPGEED